jgi:very-short-patch-repair endonuclease
MSRTNVARSLRRLSPSAEEHLWKAVRNRRLGGLKFRRQVPIDRYIVDFACNEAMLVVELDGPFHDPERDARRDEIIERCGFLVLRYASKRVIEEREGVLMEILNTAEIAGAGPPTTSSSP